MPESTDLLTRIVTELERAGAPLSAQDLADRIGTTKGSVQTTISKARKDPARSPMIDRLRKVGKGVYSVRPSRKRARGLTWSAAIEHVLSRSSGPMHYARIAEEIVSLRLVTSAGPTPARMVSAVLSKNPGGKFVRTALSVYALASQQALLEKPALSDPEALPGQPTVSPDDPPPTVAYGMYWRRDLVSWNGVPKLLGVETFSQTDAVDFSEQRGVYLLHHGHETIYVGRTTHQGLGQRLLDHTRDRLRSRWDSFSWFGLREVGEDGGLRPLPAAFRVGAPELIALLELVLIEGVEPALNRKAGDAQALEALELIQREDPVLVLQKNKLAVKALIDAPR